MNSAEYYDPKTNQWTIIAPMRNRRSGVGVIAYHNSIYALFVKEKLVFVKHDLKGVLKCIRVKIWTHYSPPSPHRRDRHY